MEDMAGMGMAAMLADVIPELVLVVGGVAILLYALFTPRRWQSAAAGLALAVVATATAATVAMLRGPEHLTFADTYARDGTAMWAKLVILVGTGLVIALSVRWFAREPRHGEYYTLLLFSSLGAILLAGATDLKQFVAALVLSSATGFVLTGYHRRAKEAAEAAMKYFLVGAFTSASMLVGAALLFGLAGSTTFPGLRAGLPHGGAALVVGVALVALAVAFKLGAFPAHPWVPDAAEGAPAPVAAFVTTVPKVGGFVLLARLVITLPPDAVGWRPMVALLAAVTMTLGNLAALWQDDVRRLLGWSAVSQSGYGLLGVVALGRSDLAVPALLFFLLAYTVANVAAFGVVVELRGRTERADYVGLARAHPVLAGSLAVAFLSFIGIPPLAGFVAKLLLFGVAIDAGYTWLAVLAVANTVISVAYYARVLAPAYFGELARPVPVLGRSAAIATVVSAAAVVGVGIVAEPLTRAFDAVSLLP
jgi:NADH-quinone oxidoreductase subunit N